MDVSVYHGGIEFLTAPKSLNRGDAVNLLKAVYTYDADGNRVKSVVTINGQTTKTTAYVGNYFEISIGEPKTTTSPQPVSCTGTTKCVFIPYVTLSGVPLPAGYASYSYYYAGSQRIGMRIKSNQLNLEDTAVYFLTDHLGGTTVTLDNSGEPVSELRYTAWGETRYTVGVTPTQRRYTGQLEAEAGLYFYNSRY